MKYIFLNLKRFDVPVEYGGVNRIAPICLWGSYIVDRIQEELKKYSQQETEFVLYLPEAHLLSAANAKGDHGIIKIGCQGVFREDTEPGGNFGAFTTNRCAAAAKALGCESVMIGHCEERKDKEGILAEAGVTDKAAINRLLNQEIRRATERGLNVLYCIGETSEEQSRWEQVLQEQLNIGLEGVDKGKVVIAYEPIWSIGPGKIPADKDYITKIAGFVKEQTGGLPVVYGGGLKADNAAMLRTIAEIDGGLIALTRFAGEIGFYPEEYLEIIRLYLGGAGGEC